MAAEGKFCIIATSIVQQAEWSDSTAAAGAITPKQAQSIGIWSRTRESESSSD